jgi:hypothetical protein
MMPKKENNGLEQQQSRWAISFSQSFFGNGNGN